MKEFMLIGGIIFFIGIILNTIITLIKEFDGRPACFRSTESGIISIIITFFVMCYWISLL